MLFDHVAVTTKVERNPEKIYNIILLIILESKLLEFHLHEPFAG